MSKSPLTEIGIASPGESHGSSTTAATATNTTPAEIQRQLRSMLMLKGAAMEIAKTTVPAPLLMETQARIEACLSNLLPEILSRSCPDHPPYSAMIYEGINALEEEGGSSQASLSSYIVSHYPDLPWGHDTFLSHHLNRLTLKGEIIMTKDGRYMLPEQISRPAGNQKQTEKKDKMPLLLLDQQEEEEVNPAPAAKRRGRGRPPKAAKSQGKIIVHEKGSQSCHTGKAEVEMEEAKEKKRRGRPPKNLKMVALMEEEEDKVEMGREKNVREERYGLRSRRETHKDVITRKKLEFH